MGQPLRVLLVEDDPNDADMVVSALQRAGFDPHWHRVDSEEDFLAHLHALPDVILSDHALPEFGGPRALELLKSSGLDVPFISVSGTIGEEVAVEAMRHGVADYLLKGNLTRLGSAVTRVLEEARLRRERKQLEEQFRQAQKLEAVGQLAGGVAHDFNNILTVIQGYATLLEQGTIENVECAREISFAVDRAAGLSKQLLSLTRTQAMQPRLIDLSSVVEDMAKLLRRSLGESVALQLQAAAGLPAIFADQGMVEQVLLNLALNARDAMPNGGRLQIATSVSSIPETRGESQPSRKAGPAVCLRVSDTGVGMPPEVQARVFEPFFTTKNVNKGTGIGLSTVLGIVQQHHGDIRVQSKVGEGTVFEVLFPADRPQPQAVVREQAPAPVRGGQESILLVDDEPTLRSMMRMALTHFGYRVSEASSASQALGLFEQNPAFDLLLTDMVLPDGLAGDQLANVLRGRRCDLKVLFTSGYHLDLISKELAGQEGVAFLQKPFSMQKLASAVRDCLSASGEAAPGLADCSDVC